MIMYHSITFGDKNTWDDWHIVPTTRPVFNPPKVKTKTLDISGGNGVIDLSESLTGYPVFNNREGSFEFIVMNDYMEWQELYSTISDYIHGRRMRAILEDDDEYYYEGRFAVNSWKSEKNNSKITIDYSVAPYKRRLTDSSESLSLISGMNRFRFTNRFYGTEPTCPIFNLETSNEAGATINFINPDLGISSSKQVSDGLVQIPEFVFYGSYSSVHVTASDSGNIVISCTYGGL